MAENEEPNFPLSFFSAIVYPGSELELQYPDDAILTLKSACLGELPENFKKDPIRLKAKVLTLSPKEDEKFEKPGVETANILISTLIPGEKEQQEISNTFTALNRVFLTISGEYPVHIIGSLSPLLDDEPGLDEEEEEEEEEGRCHCHGKCHCK